MARFFSIIGLIRTGQPTDNSFQGPSESRSPRQFKAMVVVAAVGGFLFFGWTLPGQQPGVVAWETPTEHQFGALRMDKPATHSFVFRNTGEVPLLLQTVRTTCGCTAAAWTETPVAPGQTGSVRIDFEGYQRGHFRKKIRVFFDRQRQPEILWVEGEVR